MVDERRVQLKNEIQPGSGPVVYVIAREQRVADNWALLYAQEQAQERGVPLAVLFALGPMFCSGTARHNAWMVESLQNVERDLKKLNIPFFIEIGEWQDVIPKFVANNGVGEIVFDYNPLQPVRSWRDQVVSQVDCKVVEVDARNIIPVWEASDKLEFAAHTIRKKIHRRLGEFLTDFPKVEKQKNDWIGDIQEIDWGKVSSYRKFEVDAPIPDQFTPGSDAAKQMLADFIENRVGGYGSGRNDPNVDGVSHLSP